MDTSYIKRFLKECKDIMEENRSYLIKLDSVVGDGDLGLTMGDGFLAASKAADDCGVSDIGMVLYQAGKAMASAVPSTMGTLMASGLMQAGKLLKGKETLDDGGLVEMFQAYMEGVQKRGKAQIGDKTFLDGLAPAIDALRKALESGCELREASVQAADAAEEGFRNTTKMIAVHGRAATRGEASRTLEDPGAAVAMLIMRAFMKTNQ